MFRRIDTVFLKVRDLNKAVDWYSSKLQLKLRWKVEGYAAFNLGETPLTLVASTSPQFQPVEEATFNFYAPDIKQARQHLLEVGVEVGELQVAPDVQWFWFKDLDGNRLEVCYFAE